MNTFLDAIIYTVIGLGWLAFIAAILWPHEGGHWAPHQRIDWLATLAYPALRPLRNAQVRRWARQLRTEAARLRPAMRLAEEESPAPEPPLTGRDDPEPRGCCWTFDDQPHTGLCAANPVRDAGEDPYARYSLHAPSYYTDPAQRIGAATGDFPAVLP
jgi:hypothetical protein